MIAFFRRIFPGKRGRALRTITTRSTIYFSSAEEIPVTRRVRAELTGEVIPMMGGTLIMDNVPLDHPYSLSRYCVDYLPGGKIRITARRLWQMSQVEISPDESVMDWLISYVLRGNFPSQ